MAKIPPHPFKNDGTRTTFVTESIWLPVMSVNQSLSKSIKEIENYLNSIFNPSCIKSIYLCTNNAQIINNLVSFYIKITVNEQSNKRVVFTLRNIKIKISPLAFYRLASTDVIDILPDSGYYANARYNANIGLSNYKGSDYIDNLLKLHDLLNSLKPIILSYEIRDNFCRLYEPDPDEFDDCITDELGEVFVDYDGIGKIRPITEKYIGNQYNLVGTKYYAEGTRKSLIYCVLYAETKNEFDENAIKVLRWFPKIKNKPTISECFYDLGYISRQENEELHQFMVDKHNKILFGHIEHGIVTIDAGIKSLNKTDYSFPTTLLNNI